MKLNLRYTFVFSMFLMVFPCVLSCAQEKGELIPEAYVAYKTSQEIVIDGKPDGQWNAVPYTKPFIDIEGVKQPRYQTRVKMMWDETYFYILAEMEEPHVWANLTQRDTIIFYNNDFEVFVDPDGDTHNYYELEINALNTAWDLFITKPYREQGNPVLNDWTVTNLKSAVHIEGTLNNPEDIDQGWTLEMAIPWKVYRGGYFEDVVPRDTFWRVNFSRVNWDFELHDGVYERKKGANGKLAHEYNWVWSPMGVINMHEPEKWGYVFFSTQAPSDKIEFKIPKDEEIKWEMYRWYRSQKAYFKKNNRYITDLDSLMQGRTMIEGKQLTPQLEVHSTGWNITVVSPFTQHTLIITEDGKFHSR